MQKIQEQSRNMEEEVDILISDKGVEEMVPSQEECGTCLNKKS